MGVGSKKGVNRCNQVIERVNLIFKTLEMFENVN